MVPTLSSSPRDRRRVFASRPVLFVFGFLVITWFLPGFVRALSPSLFDVLQPLLQALVIPAYLLNMFVYDGGLETLVYPVADAFPVAGKYIWDVGLLVVYYGFAVLTGALARVLRDWSGRKKASPATTFGYIVVAGLLVLGVLLVVGGVMTYLLHPTVTVTSCSASSAASATGGTSGTATECVEREVPNTFPNYATLGGFVLLVLGGSGVALDRLLARQTV